MQYVTQKDLDAVKDARPDMCIVKSESHLLTEEQFKQLLSEMDNPVLAQKQLAVKIKTFITAHIDEEISSCGKLSEYTRRWVKEYNELLDRIQHNLYGDKSVNLHIHKVSHSDIASKIRKYKESVECKDGAEKVAEKVLDVKPEEKVVVEGSIAVEEQKEERKE